MNTRNSITSRFEKDASITDGSVSTVRLVRASIWSVMWAIWFLFLKLLVFAFFKVDLSLPYVAGVGLSFFSHFLFALLIGLLIFSDKWMIRAMGYVSGVVLILFYSISIHYEIVFRVPPDISLFYYATQIKHLMPSLKSNAPMAVVIVEIIGGLSLFFPDSLVIRKVIPDTLSRKWLRNICFGFVGICLVAVVLIHTLPLVLKHEKIYLGSRNPVIWLLRSALTSMNDQQPITRADIITYQSEIGHRQPFGGTDMAYPLCGPRQASGQPVDPNASVIILILESVSNADIYSEVNGIPIMPNLRKIAEENLYFKNSYASGTKSSQVLPAIFSGLPAQTYKNFLWANPMPRATGLPAIVRRKGYQTAYFHGSDLSFEKQRTYLRMVGFDHIVDYDPDMERTVSGWGYDDAQMLSMLKDWISNRQDQDVPYLATLFTISTHDPFLLPESYTPVLISKKTQVREDGTWINIVNIKDRYRYFQESLHFLDTELGTFYQWYKTEEMPKGTILVLLGDHVTSLHNESDTIQSQHMRFSTPLIFAGFPQDLVQTYKTYTHRRVIQWDLPSTLAAYLGVTPPICDQGLNVFMPESQWPENRLVYAVGGHSLERIYTWVDECEVELDRITNNITVVNEEMPKGFKSPGPDVLKKVIHQRLIPFYRILFPLDAYLISHNGYCPQTVLDVQNRPPIGKVREPLFVSHRGNTQGMQDPIRQNKPDAIEAAIGSGFQWVEVDVRMTRDYVPVLIHDDAIMDGNGNKILVEKLTFEQIQRIPGYDDVISLEHALNTYLDQIGFLVEIKGLTMLDRVMVQNRTLVEILQRQSRKDRIIVDSFQFMTASFIRNRCDIQVGLDTPFGQRPSEEMLDSIALSGLDWVYVHYSVVDDQLIEKAHEKGLKVMVYTVNDPSILRAWKQNLPDGVITDQVSVKQAFYQSQNPKGS